MSIATTTTLAVSAPASVYGQPEVLTATVTAVGATPLGGTVAFMDGSTVLGASALTNGRATLTTTTIPVGNQVLSAVYSGGPAFGDVTSVGGSTGTTYGATPIIKAAAGWGAGFGANLSILNNPTSLATDSAGDLFIVNTGDNQILEVVAGTGAVRVVAGNGKAGYYGDGGLATSAYFNTPTGVAVDAAGDLYIADMNNGVVREVDHATGVITTVVGNGESTFGGRVEQSAAADFRYPSAVALDAAGNLFITDQGHNTVLEINHATGAVGTVAGNGSYGAAGDGGPATSAELASPNALAFDGSGNLYITTYDVVREVDMATGVITTVAGNNEAGPSVDGVPAATTALLPGEVAFDAAGNLIIADTGSAQIREVNHATGIITTIAGTPIPGYTGDGGPATSADLFGPVGVALDSSGNMYIADSWSNAIRKVDLATGVITTVIGVSQGDGGQGSLATLNAPSGVAVDSNGDLFISDTKDQRVREVNHATGVITTIAGTGYPGVAGADGPAAAAQLNGPNGLAIDAAGNLYIADSLNNMVRKVDFATGVITTIVGDGAAGYAGDGGQATEAELNNPTGVAVDAAGDVFIADSGNNVVREVNHATGVITTIAGDGTQGYRGDGGAAAAAELHDPTSVAVDPAGNLYIADSGNNVIREVNLATGVISTYAGTGAVAYPFMGNGGPATSTSLASPTGLALDPAGDLYFSEPGFGGVLEVDHATGVITTIAGNGNVGPGNGDYYNVGNGGPATLASLGSPTAIAVDASGNLFIADALANVIREVTNLAVVPSVSVSAAPLLITPNSLTVTAGQPIPALTASYRGFVNGDGPASLSSPPEFVTAGNRDALPGVYPILVREAGSPNYMIINGVGELTILPGPPPLVDQVATPLDTVSKLTILPAPPPLVELTSVVAVENTRHLVTGIRLTFSGPLGAASVDQLSAYHLNRSGRKDSFSTKHMRTIALRAAVLNGADVVALHPMRPFRLARPVQLVIQGRGPSGLLDAYGRLVELVPGAAVGDDLVQVLTRKSPHVVLSPPRLPPTARTIPKHNPAHAATDDALSRGDLAARDRSHRVEIDFDLAAVHQHKVQNALDVNRIH